MKAVSCPTCNDTGWTLGGMWCQNCVRGRQNYETIGVRNPAVQNPRNARSAAFDERQTLAQDLQPVGATVASGTSPDKRWTPAHVGRALKIVLYVGIAAAAWALNHYFGGKTTAEGRDVLEGPDTPEPATPDDFSPWEPEP